MQPIKKLCVRLFKSKKPKKMIAFKYYLPLISVKEKWTYNRKAAVLSNMAKKRGYSSDEIMLVIKKHTEISYFETNYLARPLD